MDIRLTGHARERMERERIERRELDLVLDDPDSRSRDEWVEKFTRNVHGRNLTVVVTHRSPDFALVVTAYVIRDQ